MDFHNALRTTKWIVFSEDDGKITGAEPRRFNKRVENNAFHHRWRSDLAAGYFHSQNSERVLPSASTWYSNTTATLFRRDQRGGIV